VLRPLVHLARETFKRRKAALDLHQPLGQRLVVTSGKPGQDQLARNSSDAPRNGERTSLQLFDVAQREVQPGRVAPRIAAMHSEGFAQVHSCSLICSHWGVENIGAHPPV
jgi:hypothetical protein